MSVHLIVWDAVGTTWIHAFPWQLNLLILTVVLPALITEFDSRFYHVLQNVASGRDQAGGRESGRAVATLPSHPDKPIRALCSGCQSLLSLSGWSHFVGEREKYRIKLVQDFLVKWLKWNKTHHELVMSKGPQITNFLCVPDMYSYWHLNTWSFDTLLLERRIKTIYY